MEEAPLPVAEIRDPWVRKFLVHLATDRGASVYTRRNYEQTLGEFCRWHVKERETPPVWDRLQRDDFRGYLRYLGRGKLSRATTQLRFSALRSFYRYLMRQGVVESLPIKNLALPKLEKRLPGFLTRKQMLDLLAAPMKALAEAGEKKGQGGGCRPRWLGAIRRCWRQFIHVDCG